MPTDSVRIPVSVVIPAYNEQEAVTAQIIAVTIVLERMGCVHEIIVVDDGSTDSTAACAERCGVKVLRLGRNNGYGFALKAGIAQGRFDWVLILDADLTYPVEAIPRLLERIPEYDMVVGARTMKRAAIPLIRRPGKWLLRHYAGYTVGQSVPDLNSGMRVMRKSAVRTFEHLLPSGFSFTSTITLSMLANRYKVHYEPIDYFKRVGHSKIRAADFLRIFKLITRLMMLFNPGRILLPLGALALMLGALDLRYDIIPVDSGVGMASAGGVLCALGMIAERRIRSNGAPVAAPAMAGSSAPERILSAKWPRFAISGLILAALALALPKEKLLEALHRVRFSTLAGAIPAYLAIHCLGARKWRTLVDRAGARFSASEALRLYFGGLFGSLFLPSVVGGDVVMVAMAFRRSNNRAGILLASMLNRVLDLVALALLAGVGAFLSPKALTPEGVRILNLGALVAFVAMAALVIVALLLDPTRLPAKLSELYGKQRQIFESLRRPQIVAVPLLIGVTVQFALLLLTAWIGASNGFRVPMAAWLLAWPLAKLVAMLPITLAGLGARELALAALLAPFGAEPEVAFMVGLAWAVVLVGGSLLAGLVSKILGWREAAAGEASRQEADVSRTSLQVE
jgi:uncharacterized membrane protein YbhN (UPF0104 family)